MRHGDKLRKKAHTERKAATARKVAARKTHGMGKLRRIAAQARA
jgi:hypothetical protein